MDCNEVRDNLTDYHLGNLSPDETADVAAHLVDHAECREESESVERVLGLMAFDADPIPPPPGARERVMQRMREERDKGEPNGVSLPAAPVGIPARTPHRGTGSRGRPSSGGASRVRRSRVVPALAVAVAVLALGLAGLTVSYIGLLQSNERLEEQVVALQGAAGEDLVVLAAGGTSLAPEARGMLVMEASEGGDEAAEVALGVYGMPEPPDGGGYRVWVVDRSGEYVSLGAMETDLRGNGQMQGRMPETENPAERVEITGEQAGSQQEPGPVYLQASLNDRTAR